VRAGELHFLGRTLPSEGSRFKTREGTKRGSGKVETGTQPAAGKDEPPEGAAEGY